MKRRSLRVILFFLFVVSIGAAAYEVWLLDRAIGADRENGRLFEETVTDLIILTGELKAAQRAYVAAGQTVPFWTVRVAALRTEFAAGLERLEPLARAPGTVASLDSARTAMEELAGLDGRASDYIRDQQPLMASDLIFTDGQDIVGAAAGHLQSAQQQEQAGHAASRDAQQLRQAYAVLIMAGVGLLVTLLLVPVPNVPARHPARGAAAPKERPAATVDTARPGRVLGLPSEPPHPLTDRATHVRRNERLGKVAALCADLSVVGTANELRGLLERTSAVLDGSGLVIWLADAERHQLKPVLGHGYSDTVMRRMGTIPADADNVTAAAYRTRNVQFVGSHGSSAGAVVAPLVSPAGCIGVMAAEVTGSDESPEAVQAIATILAAQLAPLLDTPQTAEDASPKHTPVRRSV